MHATLQNVAIPSVVSFLKTKQRTTFQTKEATIKFRQHNTAIVVLNVSIKHILCGRVVNLYLHSLKLRSSQKSTQLYNCISTPLTPSFSTQCNYQYVIHTLACPKSKLKWRTVVAQLFKTLDHCYIWT